MLKQKCDGCGKEGVSLKHPQILSKESATALRLKGVGHPEFCFDCFAEEIRKADPGELTELIWNNMDDLLRAEDNLDKAEGELDSALRELKDLENKMKSIRDLT